MACGGDDGGGTETVDPAGTHTQYVADTVSVPETPGQSGQYALDIDGDGIEDNSLGMSLGLLGGMGIDLQKAVTEGVDAGSVIVLADLQAVAFDNAGGVGMSFYLGDTPTPAACTDPDDQTTCGQHLDGNASITVAAGSPADALVVGQILAGTFETRAEGTVKLELELVVGQPKIELNLIGARTSFTVDATGATISSGRLGGAITSADANDNILPVVVQLVQETIAEDCLGAFPDCCTADSTGSTILALFDPDDSDCLVTAEQVETNNIIASIFAPDVDLLDENGDFNPRSDEVKDAISIGLGFTGIGATFTRP